MTPPWLQKKLVDSNSVEKFAKELRLQGLSLATLNGSFDLLHAGHLYIIHQASLQADRLLVALNSDRSIQVYKGKDRPIVSLLFRLEMMSALEFVDYVTWFEETDPREFLKKVKPDVHVNGAEYGKNCIEAQTLEEIGARLHLVDRLPHLATSSVIQKVLACAK